MESEPLLALAVCAAKAALGRARHESASDLWQAALALVHWRS
jgi:hypothetical protein